MIQTFAATAKIPTPKQQQIHNGTAAQIIARTMNAKKKKHTHNDSYESSDGIYNVSHY